MSKAANTMKTKTVILFCCAWFSTTEVQPQVASESGLRPRPAVLELFTSEGCSSCPPAEAYIGELTSRADVLPLAFHVTYWDDLGWRDQFSLSQATQRQELYSQALHQRTVYTPQVLIDGQSDYVGTDRDRIAHALAARRSGVPIELKMHGQDLDVTVGQGITRGPNAVTLVAYRRKAVATIRAGENSGRTLPEFNIVREIRPLGRWDGKATTFHAETVTLPADATDIAILVQPVSQGPIVGAVTVAVR